MASKIGSYGNIAFVATSKVIRTFSEFSRTSSYRWAQHDILNRKPKLQFGGADLDEVSFSMYFAAWHGVNPIKELDNIQQWANKGKAGALIIGQKKMGTGLWVVAGLEQGWKHVDNRGNLLAATIKITLKEYVK